MTSFAVDLQKIADKIGRSLDQTVRATTIELFSGTILSTPVGDPSRWKNPPPAGYVGGRLRGNWQVSIGAPKSGEIDRIDSSGSATVAAMQAGIGGAGSVTYLTNNLPYAERIEFSGWSGQAPEGMVRVNFARVQNILAKQARANKV